MPVAEWQEVAERLRPYIVKIQTPRGFGTGFLVTKASGGSVCGIATAAHVVNLAHYWEEPIRIHHLASEKTVLLRTADRAIIADDSADTAGIVMAPGEIPFPDDPLPLIPEGKCLRVANEVGWLGFPAIAETNLCFFSGRVSSILPGGGYLVDGVAINGVSGAPSFHLAQDVPYRVIGVVSAYIPNVTTGQSLPGLCVLRDVKMFQDMTKNFASIDDAKKSEPPPVAPPPAAQSPGPET